MLLMIDMVVLTHLLRQSYWGLMLLNSLERRVLVVGMSEFQSRLPGIC